jgi:hypothetical protein
LNEDTAKKVSGPIWVWGGIPAISTDGETYEIRNRMTRALAFYCGVLGFELTQRSGRDAAFIPRVGIITTSD